MPQSSLPTYQIGPENLVFCVIMLDELVHSEQSPLCFDPSCPCHDDPALVREFITKPLDNGLLTNREAIRLFWGKQITSSQDAAITDEPNIVNRRNEWNGYEQAMAWEGAEEQWRRATDSRDFEPDDPISDEEMEQVMSEPSPLDEDYHRTFFDGLDEDDLDDHPF